LKAILCEDGADIPFTHDLDELLDLLLPTHATLAGLRRRLSPMTNYAVNIRYPRVHATTRQVKAALTNAASARQTVRKELGLRERRSRTK
jgi:HEPN domain-containing protein